MKLSDKHLVCVIWDDAHMSLDEFTPDEIAKDFHRAEGVMSFGLLVQDDEKGVTLATDEGAMDGKFRKINFIPRGMIVEVVDFGQPKKKIHRPRRHRNDSRVSSGETPMVQPGDAGMAVSEV